MLTRSVHTQDSTTRNSHVCAVQLSTLSGVVAPERKALRPSFALWLGVLLISGFVTTADGAFLGDLFSRVTEETLRWTLSEQTTENGIIADSYEAVLVAAKISSVIMMISNALLVCSFSCVLASLSFVSFSSSSTWLQFARTCISGCQRCHATERASPAFDDNIVRYVNSPVAHGAVPTQHDPLLFLGGLPFALPAPTKIIRFFRLRNLTFKIGLVGIGNTVQRGTLHV